MYFTMVFNILSFLHSILMSLLHLWGNAMSSNSPWSLSCDFSGSCIIPRFLKREQHVFQYNKFSFKHQRLIVPCIGFRFKTACLLSNSPCPSIHLTVSCKQGYFRFSLVVVCDGTNADSFVLWQNVTDKVVIERVLVGL